MTRPTFVDTNVFVYARDARETSKRSMARSWIERLWRERRGRTSIQVLNECYFTLTRKIRPAVPNDEAWDYVRELFAWDPCALDADLGSAAREIERRYRLNWWDSLVVAAAQAQQCAVLLTEDLSDRAVYGGVTVRNPFNLTVSDAVLEYGGAPIPRPYRPRGRPRRLKALG
ncbi:MAG TPA: PIN domain-containing protein [Steroidobacteraceae bacterium]|nr:PIN domain-containing protein [Steroidobacteraceae bacterium]